MVNFLKPDDNEMVNTMEEMEEIENMPPQVVDPMDPAPLIALLSSFTGEIDVMVKKAGAIAVTDDASCKVATEMTTQAKKLASVVKKKYTELKRPYLDVTQPLDNFNKKIGDQLNEQTGVQGVLNKKISPYLQKKEAERREEERKAHEEAARIQRELEEKAQQERDRVAEIARKKAEEEGKSKKAAEAGANAAAALVEEAPVVVAETSAEVKVQTDAGTAKLKEEYAWQVLDYRALPLPAFDELNPSPVKGKAEWPHPWIRRQIKAGIRKIEGVKIYKEAKLDTRAKSGRMQF